LYEVQGDCEWSAIHTALSLVLTELEAEVVQEPVCMLARIKMCPIQELIQALTGLPYFT